MWTAPEIPHFGNPTPYREAPESESAKKRLQNLGWIDVEPPED